MPLSHEFKDVEAQVARPAMNGTMLLVDSLAAVQRGAVRLSVLPSPRTVYDSRDQGFTVNFMNPLLPIGPPHSSNVSPPPVTNPLTPWVSRIWFAWSAEGVSWNCWSKSDPPKMAQIPPIHCFFLARFDKNGIFYDAWEHRNC